jgi:hypothetical protein
MAYNTEMVCTYKLLADDDPKDIMYRSQMLQAFNLTKWDGEMVQAGIDKLYEKCKHSDQFKEIIKLSPNKFIPGDGPMSFCLLFSYHTFELMHKCIQDYLKCGKIGDENYATFIEILQKK